MNPRLVVISGSLKGTTFPIGTTEVSIGRESANSVCLNEPSVSRRHSLIKPDNGNFKLVDLDSYNGTFVNGVPVKEKPLSHGDQIAFGDVVSLFLIDEAEIETPAAVLMDEGDLITRSTVRLLREDALYLRPDLLAEMPPTARVARNLNMLLKLSTTINSIRGLPQLQRRLLELILEVIPAERGAILLVDSDRNEFTSVCGWNRLTGPDDSMKVSRTITDQVLREGVALLSNGLVAQEKLSLTPSLEAARACSVLSVPLLVFERPLGVIYLDTSDAMARFDEEHLQLLTGIAGIAAIAFENARQVESLETENLRLQKEIRIEHKMIGESAPMRAIYQFVAKVAPTDSTVLISGESGTGKELAAHAIHLNSARATKPFVAINCATLNETLLESELFGHEKGAFTGAIAQKKGKLEVADGGTIFLDEVGELTPIIQAKLLRVLQEREFERVGGTRAIKVDVRIIAATNRDLEEAVKIKDFRQDLFYRLNVVSVLMPPLRERRDDIPLLANYFANVYSKKCKRRVKGMSPEARAFLSAHDWPGNVRELENAIERAVVLGSTELITPEDLPETVCEANDDLALSGNTYQEAIKDAKRKFILKAIEEAKGNYTDAAKILGVHPNNLHRLVRSLNLRAATGK
jgi:Nif-specific regulatory protein